MVISAIPNVRIELEDVNPETCVKEVLSRICQYSNEVCRWDDYVVSVVGERGVLQLSHAELEATKLSDLEQKLEGEIVKLIIAPVLEGG